MTSSVFSETLQSITTTKLIELSKKCSVFEDQKSKLLLATNIEQDQKLRLRILVEGVKKCFSVSTTTSTKRARGSHRTILSGSSNDASLELLLKNLEKFLDQACYDPSISPKILKSWETSLTKRLTVQSLKYQYATLYGELVTEWLRAEKATTDVENASMTSEGFEKIQSAARSESRQEWERLVFEPFETDQMAISEYLRNLFGEFGTNKQAFNALHELRKSVKNFEASMSKPTQFDNHVLTWTINGLLSSGLLSEEKNAVLRDFLASPVILAEVADVLNMRIGALSTWSWEDNIFIEQRRHVTGAYHIYIDEELLQAIFLQYVGVKWSVFFKETFIRFQEFDGAWASLRQEIPLVDKQRRQYFLGTESKKPSVQSKRQGIYNSIFFMSQLPDSVDEDSSAIEGEEEVEYDRPAKRTKQTARMATSTPQQMLAQQQQVAQQQQQGMRAFRQRVVQAPSANYHAPANHRSSHEDYDVENDSDKPKSPMEKKQFLLHFLATEIIVNTRLHGDFTCARSEFFSWSPSLPHSTITSVLSFFGVSKKWLGFFTKFLEAPLKFVEDGADATTRPRKRGVPGAHALSSFFGEAVLFCLDYAVNQSTNGVHLYRMHDDFWVWSSSHKAVVQGWAAITTFTEVMGVRLNEGKTGTVRIRRDQNMSTVIDSSLPQGAIRWGFLSMDAVTGQFLIDQGMVDKHVKELQLQLQDKDMSVFAWIKAWNTYAGTFFRTNFSKPANCYGRDHVDMILSTMNRIQNTIFFDSNVVEYLKATLQQRFGISNVPDGYLFFPTSLGGLELHNPFIGLTQIRNAVLEHPSSIMDDFFEAEQSAYRRAKQYYESNLISPTYSTLGNIPSISSRPQESPEFFSFEEYTRYREEFANPYEDNLISVFNELLQQPKPEFIDIDSSDPKMVMDSKNGGSDWGYTQWVAQLYGADMKEMFGGLNIVDAGLLPMGMVKLFKEGKVKWQG